MAAIRKPSRDRHTADPARVIGPTRDEIAACAMPPTDLPPLKVTLTFVLPASFIYKPFAPSGTLASRHLLGAMTLARSPCHEEGTRKSTLKLEQIDAQQRDEIAEFACCFDL